MNYDEKEILEERLVRLKQLTENLDESFTIPGTNVKFGIDALIGLIPGGGDIIGGLFSLYILRTAIKMKLPKKAVLSIIFNITLDTTIGIVPIVGDIFDIFWKSNKRNMRIIEKYIVK
jgi:hypothetical protein